MKTLLAAAALVGGFSLGAVLGTARYERLDDHRPLCASCHHASTDLEQASTQPPHSTDFKAGCHACHVLPLREYVTLLSGSTPDWVHNPILGGQTCLECHLARGRGALACEKCHADGSAQVRLDERCEACHQDHLPTEPHTQPACRDCHVEVYLDPHGRAEHLMLEKLGQHQENP